MLGIPETWLAPTQVNPDTTGFQGHQRILGLSNGNILVAYADDSQISVPQAGRDVVGVGLRRLGLRLKQPPVAHTPYGVCGRTVGRHTVRTQPGRGGVTELEERTIAKSSDHVAEPRAGEP